MESLVSQATKISTLAVLRVLHLAHASCTTLIEDLKQYDISLSDPVNSGNDQANGPTRTVAGLLDHSMEELFVPWLEGTRFVEAESKNLVELYGGVLSRFTRYHVSLKLCSRPPFTESQRKRSSRPSRTHFWIGW